MNLFSCIDTVNRVRKKACCDQIGDLSNLNKLREMTFMLGTPSERTVPYYGDTPNSVAQVKIYEQDNVEIVYVSVKKGTVFQEHSHPGEKEVILVSKGKVSVVIGNLTAMYKLGDCFYLKKGEPHSISILEDSVLIVTFFKTVNGVCSGS